MKHEPIVFWNRADGCWYATSGEYVSMGYATEAEAEVDADLHAQQALDTQPRMIAEAVQGQPKRRVVSFWRDESFQGGEALFCGCDDGTVWWRSWASTAWTPHFKHNAPIPQD